MYVSEIMSTNVACCHSEDSDSRAAQLMWENDCGVLPVVDAAGCAIGMVTDRDLCMAAYTRGRALTDLRVGDAMSHAVVACKQQDSVEEALRTMHRHRVRRLPVLDADLRVIGLLSMNDVVRAAGRGTRRDRKVLMDSALETLAAICEHREARETEIVPAARAETTAIESAELVEAHP